MARSVKAKHFYKTPLIPALENIEKDVLLFILAYNNRILFKSAQQIAFDQNERLVLNTLHVRFLLLIYIQSIFTHNVGFATIERADYKSGRKKNNRLIITNELLRLNLIKQVVNSNAQKLPSFQITDLGLEAINTILTIAKETMYAFPKTSDNKLFTRTK